MNTSPDVPHEAAEGCLLATILRHGLDRPDDAALIVGPRALSWGQLCQDVLAMAGTIDAACGANGERVALIGDISADMVAAYLAIVASGRCAVPLQTSVHVDAVKGMLENAAPALVIGDRSALDRFAIGPDDSRRVACLDGGGLSDLVPGRPLESPCDAAPAAPFNLIYSSGTTGRPKGIVHSHAMRYRQAARSRFALSAESVMLLATPLYSNTTLMPMLATLFHGGRVAMMPKFDAEEYLDLAERLGATHTMLVPVQYQRILAAESFPRRDLRRFEVKQCTGAPLPAEDKRRVADLWPGRFFEIYGLTEGGCTCILDVSAHPDKAATVGHPAEGNDIRIVDEDGHDVPIGERGEIIGRSPMMMSGYFRDPEATAAFQWRDAEGRLYHRTGDIGVFDADGFLRLVDRKKNVIISGGFNIYAADLEEMLLAHSDVSDAVVIAVPSARWGETPLGLVVAREGADAAAIMEATNDRLGRMQRLSAVELREELPRNAAGKLMREILKKPYWEGQE